MVYKSNSVQDVQNNSELHYIMQGKPGVNANLLITLRVRFVRIKESGITGVVIDKEKSTIPEGISLSELTEDDVIHIMIDGKLTKVWLNDMNGPALKFRGQIYPLFHIQAVNDQGARVYFTFLPIEFGKGPEAGHIVYSEDIWLENG